MRTYTNDNENDVRSYFYAYLVFYLPAGLILAAIGLWNSQYYSPLGAIIMSAVIAYSHAEYEALAEHARRLELDLQDTENEVADLKQLVDELSRK